MISATTGGAPASRTRARSPSIAISAIRPCTTLRAEPSGSAVCNTTSDGRSTPSTPSTGSRRRSSGHGTTTCAVVGDDPSRSVVERLQPPREQVHAHQVGHVGRPRGVAELLGRASLRDLAPLHHDDPIGDRHRLDRVVRDQDTHAGEPVQDRSDQRAELRAGAHVERRGRLVEQQQSRFVDQGSRERDALCLAARELVRPGVRAGRREPEPGQELARAIAGDGPILAPAPATGTRRSRSRRGGGTAGRPGTRPRPAVARPASTARPPRRPTSRRRATIRPSSGSSRPARQSTTVDLPAPFGPRSATVSPSLAVEFRTHLQCRRAPRGCRRRASSGEDPIAHRDEHHERQDDEQQRDQDRGAGIGLTGLVDGERAASASDRRGSRRT